MPDGVDTIEVEEKPINQPYSSEEQRKQERMKKWMETMAKDDTRPLVNTEAVAVKTEKTV